MAVRIISKEKKNKQTKPVSGARKERDTLFAFGTTRRSRHFLEQSFLLHFLGTFLPRTPIFATYNIHPSVSEHIPRATDRRHRLDANYIYL